MHERGFDTLGRRRRGAGARDGQRGKKRKEGESQSS
jgi:hypothetical protein